GNTEALVYLRSAAKPFIAAAAVRAGVVARYGLDQRELSVMCGSHAGEPFHIEAVRSILRRIGLDESALQCGADLPYNLEARAALEAAGTEPAPIYHNCSGKHAGILALCTLLGADPATYMEPANPAQRYILDFCARLSDERAADLPLGIDGCGIPAYATTLRSVALAYMRFATLDGVDEETAAALRIVRDAMLAFPEYMSGTGEFDASLIRAGGRDLVCKGGAEGIHATALIERGAALVIKVIDGNERARPPAAIEGLSAIGSLSQAQRSTLRRFVHATVRNRTGRDVGEIRALERLSK
ncbi:MAG TPA: asparaginase, partial [Candidatus Acidoferrales bacterium]|nr:asparaginase [Candidatus Acidoferrales bacterium]